MLRRKVKRPYETTPLMLWISGLVSLASYALGLGARYWRV
jgi:hypothetical protein